jgi:hypothetical protein
MSCNVAPAKSPRLGLLALMAFLSCLSSISIAKDLSSLSEFISLEPLGNSSTLVTDQYEFSQTSAPFFGYIGPNDFDLTNFFKHQVFVNTLFEDDFIHKVYGSADANIQITAPDGIFNDAFVWGPTAGGVACPTVITTSVFSAYDSWVGIGLTCVPSIIGNETDVTIEETVENPWGDNFMAEGFATGTSGPVDISMDDVSSAGSWYLPSTSSSNGFAGEDCKSIVMQITTEGSVSWTLNAEIWVHGDENTKVILTQTFDGENMGAPIIEGCTDSNACNYYALATTDNGSCDYPDTYYDCADVCLSDTDGDGVCNELEILGCQDNSACNFNAAATDADDCIFPNEICDTCSGENDGSGIIVDNDLDDDGICDADEIEGCQNSAACNFNSAATDEGGPCIYASSCEICSGAVDGTGTVLANDDDEDGICNPDEIQGCQNAAACNFNTNATDPGVDCTFAAGCESCSGATDGSGSIVANDADGDQICDADEIVGCFDVLACNYNASASDSGDCIYIAFACDYCSGETDGTGSIVDNDSDNDLICDGDEVIGCQDSEACNFNAGATDAGVCQYPDGVCDSCSGETDGTGTIVDNDADDDQVCDGDELIGCQDDAACNYNSIATDAGDCVYPDEICETCTGEEDGSGTVVDNDADDDGVCDGDEVVGCQDASACNYNLAATDASDCIYSDGVCETCSGETDGTGVPLDNDADNDAICDANEVAGCQDLTACNYNALATDAGECVFPDGICETCTGDTDGSGTVIDNDADNDEICDLDEIAGCSDSLACNFNAEATDGGVLCEFALGACAECSGNADDGTGTVLSNDSDDDGVCDADEIAGCQNTVACNFNSAATDEDGTCIYALNCEICSGALDGTGTVLANDDDEDGVCNPDEIPGCQNPAACNFNTNATDPGDECVFSTGCESCSGATDGSGTIVDNDADDDQICDADEIIGCSDPLACNYDASATDESECYSAGEYYGCDGDCLNDSNGNGICDEIDDLISNADFNGYAEGYEAGFVQCYGEDYCGEGTVWMESMQQCVEDSACPGDINGDNIVGTGDLLMLLNDYGFVCD